MTLSSFAMVIGIACYLIGFPLIFSEARTIAWKKKFFKDDVALRLSGAICTIIAGVLLRRQWAITGDAEGLVVFVAWLVLVKGVITTWWPETCMSVLSWEEKTMRAPVWKVVYGVVLVLIGGLFTYFGIVLV